MDDRRDTERLDLERERPRIRRSLDEAAVVRAATEVVDDEIELEVGLTSEELVVARHPVEVPASREIGERVVTVRLHGDVVEISTEPVVAEELVLRRETVEERERVDTTLRREELTVDRARRGATDPRRT